MPSATSPSQSSCAVFQDRRGGEHQAAERGDAKFLQTVIGQLEVLGQPAFAAQAVPERRRSQVALEAVVPGVVDALQLPGLAEGLAADHVAAVRAALQQHVQRAILGASEHHGKLADVAGLVRTRLRHLGLQADVVARLAAKDCCLLARVEVAVAVDPVGRAGKASGGLLARRFGLVKGGHGLAGKGFWMRAVMQGSVLQNAVATYHCLRGHSASFSRTMRREGCVAASGSSERCGRIGPFGRVSSLGAHHQFE